MVPHHGGATSCRCHLVVPPRVGATSWCQSMGVPPHGDEVPPRREDTSRSHLVLVEVPPRGGEVSPRGHATPWPKASPSSSTNYQVIFQHAIFLLLHVICVVLGASLFLFLVFFYFVSCNVWLDPSILVWERDTQIGRAHV